MKTITLGLLLLSLPLTATPSPAAVYSSLDPHSIFQHLAFHELYPETPEGKQALQQAWSLLGGDDSHAAPELGLLPFTQSAQNLISLISGDGGKDGPQLSTAELQLIQNLGRPLRNRRLEGHQAGNLEELLSLPPEEVDVAHGLFLTQENPRAADYEALIDLMALQVRARLPNRATPEEIIDQINHLLFDELWFRFPPRSEWVEDVDEYTFLSSVLDGRRGVCLGISLLYYSIAQRLDLPLEIITPPGHIYLRYRHGSQVINIETTARGVHLHNEQYLGVNTRDLIPRTAKELVGMAFYNQASVYMQKALYAEARKAYETALLFSPEDLCTRELWAYSCILDGKEAQGRQTLQQLLGQIPEDAVSYSRLPEDYLQGRCIPEDIATVFMHVDETHDSILKKQLRLQKAVKRQPKFKSGWFQLAVTWFQMHRPKEALACLRKYHELDPEDPVVEYYLAQLNTDRLHYPDAWKHLERATQICKARDHSPRALRGLRKELQRRSPKAPITNSVPDKR